MNSSKGFVFELPPHLAEELRQRRPDPSPDLPGFETLMPLGPPDLINDDDNEQENDDTRIYVSGSEADDDDDKQQADDTSHTSSSIGDLTVDCGDPVLLIDVLRLSGYVPSSEQEIQTLLQSFHDALFENEHENPVDAVHKLLETGLASHSDSLLHTSSSLSAHNHLVLPYPLIVDGQNTRRMWHKLHRTTYHHQHAIVQRTQSALVRVRAPLHHLHELRQELARLYRDARMRLELGRWNRNRPERLGQLYEARNVLAERLRELADDDDDDSAVDLDAWLAAEVACDEQQQQERPPRELSLLAQAGARELQSKLETLDATLELEQEEQWKTEEEEVSNNHDVQDRQDAREAFHRFLMIVCALQPENAVQQKYALHTSLLREWNETFGLVDEPARDDDKEEVDDDWEVRADDDDNDEHDEPLGPAGFPDF